jgi:hypothetical protein
LLSASVLQKNDAQNLPSICLTCAEVLTGGRHQERPFAEQRERVRDVRRAAATPLVHRIDQKAQADAIHVLRQEVLGELPRKRHQVVVGDGSGDDEFHFMYFPMIGARSFFV